MVGSQAGGAAIPTIRRRSLCYYSTMNSAAVTFASQGDRLDGFETPPPGFGQDSDDEQTSGGPVRRRPTRAAGRSFGTPHPRRGGARTPLPEPTQDADIMRPVVVETDQQRRNTKHEVWMGIHNNPVETGEQTYMETHVKHMREDHNLKFFMYARESWTTEARAAGKTPHVHYLLVTQKDHPLRFMTLQRKYPGVHWMMKYEKSSVAKCAIYLEKEGDFFKEGEEPRDSGAGVRGAQGRRTDLNVIASAALEHGMDYVVENHPGAYVQYNQGLTRLLQRQAPKRKGKPLVVLLWGGTGTGKSHRAREELMAWGHKEEDIYVWHPQQGSWFDGYEGQEAVIMEEFRGQLPFGMLLSLLDKYCCRVQLKGSTGQFAAKRIYITSPVDMDQWYPDLNERFEGSIAQLKRRVSRAEHMAVRHRDEDDAEPLYPPGWGPGGVQVVPETPPSSPR